MRLNPSALVCFDERRKPHLFPGKTASGNCGFTAKNLMQWFSRLSTKIALELLSLAELKAITSSISLTYCSSIFWMF